MNEEDYVSVRRQGHRWVAVKVLDGDEIELSYAWKDRENAVKDAEFQGRCLGIPCVVKSRPAA